ncbi:histidine kinase N-terminal 7TM domain-containing protein [Haloarchaeobius salinus]|uniref:histidine kinase N-terminal 7TM domain-containing protein n=1 Tax=Haloarchaeobius salinus TaxID=1198298 RepID=UPI0021092BAA|nr:histidine kinase N-terminal 7TM domain-containing protein [Haloarchaeobius salinus]
MEWQPTVYLVPFVFSALLSFGLFLYVVVGRTHLLDRPVVRMFVALTFSIAVWAVGDVFQLLTTGLLAKRAWLGVQFIGASGSTLGLLGFALAYTDNDEWLTPRVFALLAVEMVVALGLLATSPRYHQLYVVTVDTATDPATGLVMLDRTLGPAATLHVVYSYALIVVAIALLLRAAVRSDEFFRSQSLAVVVAVTVPFVVNVGWFVGLGSGGNLDFTVLGFSFSAVALWYAISRYSLLAVSPVARKTVVENMADAVVVVDQEGRIVDANPAVGALGVSRPSTLVGERAVEAIPSLAPVLADDDPADELSVETDDGTRHFAVSRQPLESAAAGTTLLILRDVTEQRQIEQRYQRLIENSSDMITVLGADGRIKYDSPAIEGLLGYDQDEWVGRRGRERLHPDDQDRMVAEFLQGVDERFHTSRHEYRIRHANGSWRVFESFASNLLHDPVVEGMVLNSRDVTDRKRRERELERTNERLDEFASVVSHDLRNPLTVGNGYLQAAKEGDMEALEVVEEAHERMERIVDDALELARQGDAVQQTESVDLTTAARRAWATVETGDAVLQFAGEGTVAADRDRLRRVFENLFRNCVEHATTDDGPVTVTVGVEHDPSAADPAVTRFYVSDDGPGIPADRRERVFESGVTTNDEGTGFGLAIVESIARAHGWSVVAEESETGGARFAFAVSGSTTG